MRCFMKLENASDLFPPSHLCSESGDRMIAYFAGSERPAFNVTISSITIVASKGSNTLIADTSNFLP